MSKKNIVIVAGGTAGHVFPAAVIANILGINNSVLCFSDKRGEKFWRSEAEKHIHIHTLPITNLQGSFFKKFLALYMLMISILIAIFKVRKNNTALVIGFGSFTSFPVLLAAVLWRIPIILHEQNSVLGKVNRIFSKYAKILFTSFKETKLVNIEIAKIIYVGNPLRQKLLHIQRRRTKITKKLQILVVGGSQGSKMFDSNVTQAITALSENIKLNLQIFQQTREENISAVKKLYDSDKNICEYTVKPFFDDILQIMANSDLIISRGGASAISEILYLQIPSILIPIAISSDNHQYYNAKFLQNIGGAVLVEEKQINKLGKTMEDLLANEKQLNEMQIAMKKINRNNAAQEMVIRIQQLLMNHM